MSSTIDRGGRRQTLERSPLLEVVCKTRWSLLLAGGVFAAAGCLNDSGDGNGNGGAGSSFSSPAFTGGTAIPEKYTCDGEDISPISNSPD